MENPSDIIQELKDNIKEDVLELLASLIINQINFDYKSGEIYLDYCHIDFVKKYIDGYSYKVITHLHDILDSEYKEIVIDL